MRMAFLVICPCILAGVCGNLPLVKFRQRCIRFMAHGLRVGGILLLVLIGLESAHHARFFREERRLQDAFASESGVYEKVVDRVPLIGTLASKLEGNLWCLKAGNVTLSDPLAAVEHVAATRGRGWRFAPTSFWLVVTTLLLGRVFCGYLCPVGLLLELTDVGRRALRNFGLQASQLQVPRWTQYAVLCAGVVAAAIGGNYVLAWVYAPRIFSVELDYYLMTGAVRFGVLFLAGVFLFDLLISRRGWCTSLCPGGALYSLLGKTRLVRVKRVASRCTDCGACRPVCPYDLRPDKVTPGGACDNCTRCVIACPEQALVYGRTSDAEGDVRHE